MERDKQGMPKPNTNRLGCVPASAQKNRELGVAGEAAVRLGGAVRIPAEKFWAVCGPLPGPAGQCLSQLWSLAIPVPRVAPE